MKNFLKPALITALIFLSHIVFVNTASAQTALPEACNTLDVDDDSDGLIEICYLEDLNAIRFVLDGSGYKADSMATTSTLGCPSDGCVGYELVRDLDFNDDDSYSSTASRITWTTGQGWEPIGEFSDAFRGEFEGNDFTISNLTIDRSGTSNIGLFGVTGIDAEIANVGLLNVSIIGDDSFIGGLVGGNTGSITNSYATGSVSGDEGIGGLVGGNTGSITNSYATGSVSGDDSSVGGLVGDNEDGTITNSYATGSVSGDDSFIGGLVGDNEDGTITNSYATGSVSGDDSSVGGLVGDNEDGTITNSYATGSVSGDDSSVGGLVGDNEDGTITNSYATGSVSGDDDVGGLVGFNDGTITNSYWDISTSGIAEGFNGMGKTTKELQSPTTATGIYSSWSPDVWDFGTSEQYPVGIRHTNAPRFQPLACAAFFPNIGQTELFFRTQGTAVNENGFTIDLPRISPRSVEQIGETIGTISVIKVTLNEEIVADDSISVSYKPTSETPDDEAISASCSSALGLDSDGDGIIDVADNNPFDEDDRSINTNVASETRIAPAPTTSSVFYSRGTVIRSLLRGEEFTYISGNDQGEFVRETFTENMAMTPARYFGINGGSAVRIFRDEETDGIFRDESDSSRETCGEIRGIIEREYHLNKIRINQHCTDVTDNFGDEPEGERRYWWAAVDNNGYLTSEFLSFEVRVLPEINLLSQSSYLHAVATTKTIYTAVLYQGIEMNSFSVGSDTTPSALQSTDYSIVTAYGTFVGNSFSLRQPQPGETIRHWIGGSSTWYPNAGTIGPIEGGHNFNDAIIYAAGANNSVDIKVAEADEPVTQISYVVLYDPNEARTVTSMVAGRTYLVETGFSTNIADITNQIEIMALDGYTVMTTTTGVSTRINAEGNSVTENIHRIVLRVNDISTTRTITVGWNRIGTLEDLRYTYLATPTEPENYTDLDFDVDRIPDSVDFAPNYPRILQVAVENTVTAVNFLATDSFQPLFVTDLGLIIAKNQGESEVTYSVANIPYDQLSEETKDFLAFTDDGLDRSFVSAIEDVSYTIDTIGTYGIVVDYAINSEGKATGSITYTSFPISTPEFETLSVLQYDYDSNRWKDFKRDNTQDGYADTWYAIRHPNPGSEICPTDIRPYREGNIGQSDHIGDYFLSGMHEEHCIMLVVTDGGPYDSTGLDGIVGSGAGIARDDISVSDRGPGLVCSAFFPNIGQTELFFRTQGTAVNENGFTIDGRTISPRSVEQIGETIGTVSVLKVTLNEEIVADDSISVSYKPTSETPDDEAISASCSSDSRLDSDSDGDGIIDVADNNPFDEDDSSINTNVASATPIAPAPTTSSVFYSRGTVIRSLLRGDEFTYIDSEQGEFVRETFTAAMTPAQYFGIADPDARIFRDDGEQCARILETYSSDSYHFNKINIAEHCTDITDSLGDEPAGERPYVWVTVNNNGHITSEFLTFNVEVLPEINFSGQASYLYTNSPSTRQTVVISTYNSDSDSPSFIDVTVRSGNIATTPSSVTETQESLRVRVLPDLEFIAEGEYTIATSASPMPGQTITHWLGTSVVDDEEGETMAWHPATTSLRPREGGVIQDEDDFADSDDDGVSEYEYAIGPNNNIDVRLVAADEDITRIRQVWLYEVENPETTTNQVFQVSSVVAGRTYYAIADFEASTDTITIERSPTVVEGYTITETTPTAIEAIRSDIGRDEVGLVSDAIIQFTVSDDFTPPTEITVGWDSIGSAERVIETYLVNTEQPPYYDQTDTNRNNIPDNADLNLNDNRLQVGTGDNNTVDYLSTQGDQPVFLTYEALVIANDIVMEAINPMDDPNPSRFYSAADIDYGGLSEGVRATLGFDEADRAFEEEDEDGIPIMPVDVPIERLAAFGVREVDYQIDDNNRVVGGITHTVFPISSNEPGEILYVGKYNRLAERWERFERGTFVGGYSQANERWELFEGGTSYPDTWYGIVRPNNSGPCPTSIEEYKNRHQAAGEDGQGFVSGAQNCIMLAITDGGPYDSSGLDGRVVDDTAATVRRLLVRAAIRAILTGGFGSGAVDMGDVILLLMALLSLVAITMRRIRKKHY